MNYPGRLIKMGEADAAIVRALKQALNKTLVLTGDQALVLDEDNPVFVVDMKQAVQLFQARHADANGQPLKVDGQVGALTWAALFGARKVPQVSTGATPFLKLVLQVAGAAADAGVREIPKNSNRGPQVNQYLICAGVSPGLSWCCAFTYWSFNEAARQKGRANPMYKTAGCLAHWNNAAQRGARRVAARDAAANPALLKPGMVFIMDFGGGLGHTGFVERVDGGYIHTIEGNTDPTQSREGGGVYRLARKINSINKGFIDYAGL